MDTGFELYETYMHIRNVQHSLEYPEIPVAEEKGETNHAAEGQS